MRKKKLTKRDYKKLFYTSLLVIIVLVSLMVLGSFVIVTSTLTPIGSAFSHGLDMQLCHQRCRVAVNELCNSPGTVRGDAWYHICVDPGPQAYCNQNWEGFCPRD